MNESCKNRYLLAESNAPNWDAHTRAAGPASRRIVNFYDVLDRRVAKQIFENSPTNPGNWSLVKTLAFV